MKNLGKTCTYIFVLLLQFANAQYNNDYKLLNSETFSKDYVLNIREEVNKQVELQKLLNKKDAAYFFEELFRLKRDLFESGNVFLPNTLSLFLDTIANTLIETEPKLKGKIKIYLTKQCGANAFCLADGSVFINIGLLGRLDKESELAFIIAHELGHIALNHSLKDFSKTISINKMETEPAYYSTAFRSLRFSRESEYEADSYALSLMNSAGYETVWATTALNKLRVQNEVMQIDFEKLFTNEFFKLDTTYKINDVAKSTESLLKVYSKSVTGSKVDDLYETHPDIDKRINSLKEIEKNLKIAQLKNDTNRYSDYKILAQFEICNINFCKKDYLNSIINSAKLLKLYPDNAYLLTNISKSLYWISHCKEVERDKLKIEADFNQNTADMVVLYLLLDKLSLKDVKQMSYAFLRCRETKINTKDQLSFYLALTTENYIGATAAREYYKSYIVNFPTGLYYTYVNNKLK